MRSSFNFRTPRPEDWGLPPFGPEWFRGPGRPRGPRLERGDLRYALLSLLAQRPAHGYELIKGIEEQFAGFYSPSPGTVYPTLQYLEDLGYVTAETRDGRKTYTITDEGRAFLAENQEIVDAVWRRFDEQRGRRGPSPEMREVANELFQLGKTLKAHYRDAVGSPEATTRVRDILRRTRDEIDAVFAAPPAQSPDEQPAGEDGQQPAQEA